MNLPKECTDIRNRVPGLEIIYPDGYRNVSVQCEEGGWTVCILEWLIGVNEKLFKMHVATFLFLFFSKL